MRAYWDFQYVGDLLSQQLSGVSIKPPIVNVGGDVTYVRVVSRGVFDALGEPTGELAVLAEMRRRVLAGEYSWVVEPPETNTRPKDGMLRVRHRRLQIPACVILAE